MCIRSRGRRSGCFFIHIKFVYNSCTKQKKPLISTVPDYVVEMMGVKTTHFGCLYACFNC